MPLKLAWLISYLNYKKYSIIISVDSNVVIISTNDLKFNLT
jgi:hypothetical protein